MASASTFEYHYIATTSKMRTTFSQTKAFGRWSIKPATLCVTSFNQIGPSLGFVKLKPCLNGTWITWFEHRFLGLQTDLHNEFLCKIGWLKLLPGHERRLQVPVSVWFPVHGLPPFMGAGSVQVRVRDHVPLSHDVLHLLQEDQVAHWPSTAIYINKI